MSYRESSFDFNVVRDVNFVVSSRCTFFELFLLHLNYITLKSSRHRDLTKSSSRTHNISLNLLVVDDARLLALQFELLKSEILANESLVALNL